MAVFAAFFWRVLTHGHESDIPSHLILATYCQNQPCPQLPHKGFSQALMLSYNLLEMVGAAPLAESLASPETQAMRGAHLRDLSTLLRRGAILTAEMPGGHHFELLHLSAALLLGLFVAANFYVIFLIIKGALGKHRGDAVCLMLALITIVLSAIHVPWFSRFVYFGQWGPSVWHSPTTLMLQPLSILGFVLGASCFVSSTVPSRTRVALFSAVLFASAWVKPGFAIVMIPSLACYLALTRPRDLRLWLMALVAVLPTVLLISDQTLGAYGSATTTKSRIVIDFASVWGAYTPSIPVSIVTGLAFPMAVLVMVLRRERARSSFLLFAWLLATIGMLEGLLLAETGQRRMDGNLIWGYSIAIQIVHVFSVAALARLCLARPATTESEAPTSGNTSGFAKLEGDRLPDKHCAVLVTLLGLHLVSGVYYLWRYAIVGNYH